MRSSIGGKREPFTQGWLFILLKHKLSLPRKQLLLLRQVWELWRTTVHEPVRTYT